MPNVDCLVVGAGPAGLTATLYLRRYQRTVLLADTGSSRALGITRAHNYPGFGAGLAGQELLLRLRQQVEQVQGEVTHGEVTALELRPGAGFSARLNGQTVQAQTVLLATGVVDVLPPLPGVDDVQRQGLLRQCPICDGHEHRGQRIAVLGDGAHAACEARFIAHYSPHVVLVGLAAAAPADEGVPALVAPAARLALAPTGGVRLHLQDDGVHDVDVVYAALGVRPRSQLGRHLGAQLDEGGNLVVDAHCRTSVPGLLAAGDVVNALDQLTVATAHGAIAATCIHNSLPRHRHVPDHGHAAC